MSEISKVNLDGVEYSVKDETARENAGNGTEEISGDYIPVPATATVGQIIQVSAVNTEGKPTAWVAVDMPSGEEKKWKLIADITTTEELSELSGITTDAEGNALSVDELYLITNAISSTETAVVINVQMNDKITCNITCGASGASQETGRNVLYVQSMTPKIVFHGTWIVTNTESAKTLQWYEPKLATFDSEIAAVPAGTKINKIGIYKTPNAAMIASGSRFVIYGR